jgi:hypothetical protein
MASLGGVLLQFVIPGLSQYLAVSHRVRQRSVGAMGILTW